jgi:cell division protease FtsH
MSDLGIIPINKNSYREEEISGDLPEKMKEKIENERQKIINDCQEEVKQLIQEKEADLHLLVKNLLEKRTLNKEDLAQLLNQKENITEL